MANPIKYSISTPSNAVGKGNLAIGIDNTGYGPTAVNGWFADATPSGYYQIYETTTPGISPLVYSPSNSSELINFVNRRGGSVSNEAEALEWITRQPNLLTSNYEYPSIYPKIVMDGLSCYLDASNPESFAGGTTWNDISGNGLVFSPANGGLNLQGFGGGQGLAFNGSGYYYSADKDQVVDMGGDCTLILWIYGANVPSRRTIFQKNGTIAQSYQQEIACTWEVGTGTTAISWYSRRTPNYDATSYGGITTDAWTMWSLKMSTGLTSAARLAYSCVNGNAYSQNVGYSRSNTALVPASTIIVGNGYAGCVAVGALGAVLTYNKMLSDVEINQNFQAMRGNYGI